MHAPEADSAIIAPLRDGGVLDASMIEKGRAYIRENGGLLGDALLRLNLVREPDFLRVFAEHHSARSMRASGLRAMKLDPSLLERLGVRSAERLRACPIRWDDDTGELHVVAAVPLVEGLEAEVRKLSEARSVAVYVASAGGVSALIRRAYYGESDAFDRVTANGAGPSMPSSAPTNLFDDDEVTGSATHAMPALPSRGEGKTVMVDMEALTIAGLRQENARYRIAHEFHRRVSLERSLEAMIDRILSVIFELTQADGAAIWLNTGQFASKMKTGEKKPLEVPRTIIDQALIAPSGILTHNALIDDRFDRSKSVMIRGVRSVMAVAIRTRNGTLGVLYVESTSMSAAFTEEDLSMLDAIAAQAAMLLDNAALVARVKQEVEHRVGLSRFLSPAAVEEVLSGRMAVKMEGASAEVTVLFADIRGFTTMSSQMPPEEVVRFLNTFFSEAVEAISRHHGIVDKFIGDCVMAMWGAPVPREDDARNAVLAGLELVQRASRIQVNGAPLEVGVGINTGPAVVGAIGSQQRFDYTAIGATVNLAARVCGIARAGEVLISSDTLMRAGPGVAAESNEPVILKGLETPMVPYSVRAVTQPLQLNQAMPTNRRAEVPTQVGASAAPRPKPSSPRRKP